MCTNRENRVGHVKRRGHWGPTGITITHRVPGDGSDMSFWILWFGVSFLCYRQRPFPCLRVNLLIVMG